MSVGHQAYPSTRLFIAGEWQDAADGRTLWINMPAMPSAEMPFGGIKDSGYGSEGGPEALDAYLNVRAIAVMNS